MSVYLITISEALGRFHPVLVHMPIGILVLAALLHWLQGNPKLSISNAVVKLAYAAGIGGALLSATTGFLLNSSGDYEGEIITWHLWLAIFTTLAALLVLARYAQQKKDARWLSLAMLLLLTLTGHFGGSLTHGEDYLTSGWGSEPAITDTIRPIANVQEAQIYADVVQPLLQSRCVSCHGPQKQKGKLRLDSPETLMKGGEEGLAIEAGNGAESEMIKRLLLPREDEKHMPPKEKPQLTEAQVALLHWWIDQGAPFNKKVAELQQPQTIKPILTALQSSETPSKESIIPTEEVPMPDAKAVKALQDKGVVLLPVLKESGWMAANFVTADFKDADAQLLLPIKEQLLTVRLNGAGIGDATLAVLSQCANITVLQLNETAITDKGLTGLRSLERLRSLSLVGTRVTAEGLVSLQGLPALKHLFVYRSPAAKEVAKLKTIFPKTAIDTGGYRLPVLASDTTLVQAATRN